ncbi:MAG TPA: DinB family protein [Candidatus Dormibacteraeota bacterium]|nr:DinB family protein [Candidatus Dormibacteraeota bacterium]
MSLWSLYEGWERFQIRLLGGVGGLDAEALALQRVDGWPVWALVSHLSGTRVYWLCGILKEPGNETTPFGLDGEGWEDHPEHPRSAEELVTALETSWAIVASCLDRWTPPMLSERFERRMGDQVQWHSRSSVLTRMMTHDAYHTGEISLTLGSHGRGAMDPWDRPPPPPRA